VLTQPEGLTNDMLARVLSDGWGLTVASIGYLAVGFGSHHWEVVDADAVRWFVTADDLDLKQESAGEPDAAAFGRLRAALATALDLRDGGATFVIAPVPTRAGQPLALTSRRMGVALYPYVDGQSFSWGDFSTPAQRRGVLDLIVALHTAPAGTRRHAMAEDFAVLHRDELKLACLVGHPDLRGRRHVLRPEIITYRRVNSARTAHGRVACNGGRGGRVNGANRG